MSIPTWTHSQTSFSARGKRYKPSTIRSLSVPFTEFHDVGAIGSAGKYKGMPVPYGSSRWHMKLDSSESPTWFPLPLIQLIRASAESLKAAGAEDFWLYSTVHFDCATPKLSFSESLVKELASLDDGLSLDFARDLENPKLKQGRPETIMRFAGEGTDHFVCDLLYRVQYPNQGNIHLEADLLRELSERNASLDVTYEDVLE